MSNVSVFEDYLQEIDFFMEQLNDEDGVFFRVRQSFETGGEVILVVSFNDSEDIIDLYVHNIAHITNPLKKEHLHNLLNELNVNYRFIKFMELEGRVSAQYSITVDQNSIDPQYLMDLLKLLFDTTEENYPKFMKLQWA